MARDLNVEEVVDFYRQRAEHGLAKYGTTTDRVDLSLNDWLQHAKEEAMDFVVYINRVQRELRGAASKPIRPVTDYDKAIDDEIEVRNRGY